MVAQVELTLHILWLIGGLAALYFGAEWLVKGASEIALKLGVSPLVVGLTVVAFGTSAPELLVCLESMSGGDPKPDVALGNIIGSNICNIALILGVGALMRPIVIHKQIIKREVPILLVASVVFILSLLDGQIQRWEGVVMALGIVIYVISSLKMAGSESQEAGCEEFSEEEVAEAVKGGTGRVMGNIGLVLVGLVTLKYGAEWLVTHGSEIARHFNVSEAIIALLIFAIGTSLPELATAIIASRKGQGDIITGNAVGSCIFNLLAVIGITASFYPLSSGGIEWVDLGVMLGVILLIMPFMWTRMRLNRLEGAVLLIGYLAYCVVRSSMDSGLV